ncbi:MAG: hypothetical protein R3C27_07230 [Hyphomonadaceae bacterium]
MADKKATPGSTDGKKPIGKADPPGQVGQAARPLNPNSQGKNNKK